MNWFAQAGFWSRFYEYMFPAESFEQAASQVDDIMKLTGITSGAMLDLCCGPGRHCIPFTKAGFDVTGVDLQPFLLGKARAYATRESVTIDFVEEDVRHFQRVESFDLVLNMFSSFGYFSDREDDFSVLENAYASLRNGGQILLDLRGKEIHAMRFAETISSEMPNGDLVFQRTRNNEDWTRAITTWICVHDDRADSFEITLNLYSGAELRNLLRKAGFRKARLYGNLKGSPYDHNASRLVALAEKP